MAGITIGVAGAGFSGAVLARQLAELGGYEVHVYDERAHIAGNCHTVRDSSTGVMLHRFGPHIFHTSREDVWTYVQRFARFGQFTNRIKALTSRGIFSLPVNLLTINQFFGKTFNPKQAEEFVSGLADKSIIEPRNFEEQALKMLGRELYEAFFRGYTRKQWGVDPKEIPASVLKRLPVRFNYDDNYFNDKYQGIPVDGYTALIEGILKHPGVHLHLESRFAPEMKEDFAHTFYCGPLDGFFGFKEGRLGYRTLRFEDFTADGDYQGNAIINYCQEEIPYTRITEHKHFAPWETHGGTFCSKEFSSLADEKDNLYYPIRLDKDKEILARYIALAKRESGITFVGRLGTYRYLDMHVVIAEALDLARNFILAGPGVRNFPVFSEKPL